MKKIKLDQGKLLGFKILPQTPKVGGKVIVNTGATIKGKIGEKIGGKAITKLGGKIGVKLGAKVGGKGR